MTVNVFNDKDREFAKRAIALASNPIVAPHPNPRVGCVIVKNNKIIGEGFHRKAGTAHAEINALEDCTDSCAGGSMYVTLEPCSISGRTPPCVNHIIESGIGRVVACTKDPNPAINGQGIEMLRSAGVQTEVGIFETQAAGLNRGFFKRHRSGLPWMTVKVGASLDGRIATKSGESKWITDVQSRNDVHRLRAQAAAILTGSGTIEADDPNLNCRLEGVESSLIRVVADSSLKTSPNAKLFTCNGDVIVAAKKGCESIRKSVLEKVARIIEMPETDQGIDCRELMSMLAKKYEVNDVLVEAGPRLVGSLLDQKLVDELIIYVAPSILGNEAKGMALIPGMEKLSDRMDGKFTDIQEIGDDLRITMQIC